MAIKIEGGTTVKGNAVGFTAKGETVCISRRERQTAYRVSVVKPGLSSFLSNPRTQTFASISEARAYAATLVDEAKTLEMAWWPVAVV